ncbi:MAG: PadR family transcriptional regulator [Candidatus Anstonellales archaeon]
MGISDEVRKEVRRIERMSDAQLGKFMIKKFLAVFMLWMLKKREMHGYGIIKTMQEEGMHRATPSNVYPILKKMVRKGYLKVREKTEGGRRKKYYKTTLKGTMVLEAGRRWFLKGLKREFFKEMVR